jgi:hypothetical protein
MTESGDVQSDRTFGNSYSCVESIRRILWNAFPRNMAKITDWRLAAHPSEFLDFFPMKC